MKSISTDKIIFEKKTSFGFGWYLKHILWAHEHISVNKNPQQQTKKCKLNKSNCSREKVKTSNCFINFIQNERFLMIIKYKY